MPALKLKEVTNDIIFWAQENIPELGGKVRRSKGEEDGAEWNSYFPACFIKYVESEDMTALNDGSNLIMSWAFELYLAVKKENSNDGFEDGELAEEIFDRMNGQRGKTTSGADYTVIGTKCAFYKKVKTVDFYRIKVKVL